MMCVSSSKTVESLYNLITSVLQPYNYKSKLVAQCYDSASVMAGHVNGLQNKIRTDSLYALFTHFYARELLYITI